MSNINHFTSLYKSHCSTEPDLSNNEKQYIPRIDKRIFEDNMERIEEKMKINIKNILSNISKLKGSQYKKYQISGYHEYKKIKELISTKYKYELVFDDGFYKNKVVHINGSYDSACCTECDGRPIYEHVKVPVMYIKICENDK